MCDVKGGCMSLLNQVTMQAILTFTYMLFHDIDGRGRRHGMQRHVDVKVRDPLITRCRTVWRAGGNGMGGRLARCRCTQISRKER